MPSSHMFISIHHQTDFLVWSYFIQTLRMLDCNTQTVNSTKQKMLLKIIAICMCFEEYSITIFYVLLDYVLNKITPGVSMTFFQLFKLLEYLRMNFVHVGCHCS